LPVLDLDELRIGLVNITGTFGLLEGARLLWAARNEALLVVWHRRIDVVRGHDFESGGIDILD